MRWNCNGGARQGLPPEERELVADSMLLLSLSLSISLSLSLSSFSLSLSLPLHVFVCLYLSLCVCVCVSLSLSLSLARSPFHDFLSFFLTLCWFFLLFPFVYLTSCLAVGFLSVRVVWCCIVDTGNLAPARVPKVLAH